MASNQKYAPTRTIRVNDETWERAKSRAESEGLTISQVLTRFVTGYGERKIEVPKMQIVYPAAK